jgi:hypothetical protein
MPSLPRAFFFFFVFSQGAEPAAFEHLSSGAITQARTPDRLFSKTSRPTAQRPALGVDLFSGCTKPKFPSLGQALDVAARMLGSDRSRGYCLEMICADFLAGANLDNGDPELLILGVQRFLHLLTPGQRHRLTRELLTEEAA